MHAKLQTIVSEELRSLNSDFLFQRNVLMRGLYVLCGKIIRECENIFILRSQMIQKNVPYLKYGPCRPETRLVVGVKIQTENATHLVPRAESAA